MNIKKYLSCHHQDIYITHPRVRQQRSFFKVASQLCTADGLTGHGGKQLWKLISGITIQNVDGSEILHQLRLVVLFRYLQGYIHLRWCRISSINSI